MADPRIFVSYRRDDAAKAARSFADELGKAFGKDQVFIDVENIVPGTDFALALLRTLRRCDVLVVIIGPKWLSLRNGAVRRIDDPMDFVRMEIAEGLSRALPIVPVLVERASMPAEGDLPEKIRLLHRRQAVAIGRKSAGRDRALVVEILRRLLERVEQERVRHEQGGSVRDYFEVVLPYQLRLRGERAASLASEVHGSVLFNVTGVESGSWTIVLDHSGPRVERGPRSTADLVIDVTDGAMRDMMAGRFDARAAVARGAITLRGDLKLLPHIATFVFGG